MLQDDFERRINMSIITSGKQYSIPKRIKDMITDDFLKEFRNQLFRINDYHIGMFAEDGIPINTSTGGWYAALGKACLLTGKEGILRYWNTLPWYKSDIFDGELADMLVERHFILGDLSEVIEQQLGIKEDDLRVCNDCMGLFIKDMVVEIDGDDSDLVSRYRCLHCNDVLETKDKEGSKCATDYYKSVMDELKGYSP